jgi:hypothetical protein
MEQVTVEIGEFLPDKQEYGLSVFANNCIPQGGIYRELRSQQAVTMTGLTSRCLGGIVTKSKSGSSYTYVGDSARLYSIAGDTITQLNSGYTASPNWEFIEFGDNVVAVNGWTDAPQSIVKGGVSFAALAGSPPKARHIAVVRDFVVMGNIHDGTEKPNFVRWSGLGNQTQWTIGTNQADEQEIPSGGHVMKVVGGEYGTVLLENAVQRMTYVGTPLIFQFDEVDSRNGLYGVNSVVKVGSVIYYLGKDGFYANGGSQSQSISAERVSRWFFDNVDTAAINDVIGAYDPVKRVIFWLFKSVAAPSTIPDRALIYSPESNRFVPADIAAEWAIESASSGISMDSLTQIQGTLVMDDVVLSMDDPSLQGGQIFMGFFDSAHRQTQLTGPALEATLETPEKDFVNIGRSFIKGVRPRVEGAGGVTVSLGTRNDGSAESYTAFTNTNSRTGYANFRARARYARARFKITGGFTSFYAADFLVTGGGNL